MTKSTDKTILHVQPRTIMGKKSKNILATGKIPGNIYGQGKQSAAIEVDKKALFNLKKSGADSALFYLKLEGDTKDTPVLLGEYDHHAVSGVLRHVSFRRVNLKEKVTAEVSVEVINAPVIPDTNLLILKNELEIKALPSDIPESIVVDASVLVAAGDSISVAQLDYDKEKVEIILPEDATPEETLVVLLQEFKEEVETETPETVITGEAAPAEASKDGDSDKKAE